MLKNGINAPEINLLSSDGNGFKLSDFKGKPVILVFYPANFTSVCTNQLALYNEIHEQGLFDQYDAEIVGISVDSVESHKNFSQELKLNFPLLADDNPVGEISKIYDTFDVKAQTSKRVLYVIDKEGIIHWGYESPIGDNPGADGIFDALDSLNGG